MEEDSESSRGIDLVYRPLMSLGPFFDALKSLEMQCVLVVDRLVCYAQLRLITSLRWFEVPAINTRHLASSGIRSRFLIRDVCEAALCFDMVCS